MKNNMLPGRSHSLLLSLAALIFLLSSTPAKASNYGVPDSSLHLVKDASVECTPVLTCPSSQSLFTGSGATTCTAAYTIADPVSDNCSGTTWGASFSGNGNGNPTAISNIANGSNSGAITFQRGVTTVTLNAADGSGSMATSCSFTVTVTDNTPPTPSCTPYFILNLDADNSATLSTEDVYDSGTDNCGQVNQLSVSPNTFDCDNVSLFSFTTVTLTVSDDAGNTATCTSQVIVRETTSPTIVCRDTTVYLDANGSATVNFDDLIVSATDNCGSVTLFSLGTFTFSCDEIGSYALAVGAYDASYNISTCDITLTIADNLPPTLPSCEDITLDLDGFAGIAFLPFSYFTSISDNCGTVTAINFSEFIFDCGDIGTTTTIISATDDHGNTASCSFEVTVQDVSGPSFVICESYVIVTLGADNTATVNPADLLDFAHDNCGTVTPISASPASFDCDDVSLISPITVTLTVSDDAGNTSTCTSQVLVRETTPPTVVCRDTTVYLDANGSATVNFDDLIVSATDNCGSVTLFSLGAFTFSCDEIGSYALAVGAYDASYNISTCDVTLTIADNLPPTLPNCEDITLDLDGFAGIAFLPFSYFTSISDNCGTVTAINFSEFIFDCGDIGTTTTTISATDDHGNTASCSFEVTVQDVSGPVFLICKSDVNVYLDANGSATVDPAALIGFAHDNCGTVTPLSASPASFDCDDYGITLTVTLTVTDDHGNTATCNGTVIVADTLAPVITCQDKTVYLDANGQGSVALEDLYLSSTDNCGSVTRTTTETLELDCDLLGEYETALSATDDHGNTSYCYATITVADNTAPTVTCKSATVYLDANGSASLTTGSVYNSGSDNCSGVNQVSVTPNTFDCDDTGTQTALLTVNDDFGNAATCQASVTVLDLIAPTVSCKNITKYLNGSGNASIAYSEVISSNADNCATVTGSTSPNAFTCSNLGANIIQVTAQDGSGNTATCSATVTVADNTAPTITCPANQTVSANASCSGTVGSWNLLSKSDNCTASGSIVQTQTQTGTSLSGHNSFHTVTLTATDAANNSASCSFTVTLKDITAPTLSCPANQTLAADATCSGTVGSWNLLSKSDNCTASGSIVQTQTQTGTTLSGHNSFQTVTLTGTDAASNSASCSFTVTLKDVSAPAITCPANQTVAADATCSGTVGSWNLLSKSDNCTASGSIGQTQSQSGTTLSGHNSFQTVTLTATDAAGNSASCSFTVTLKDITAPTITCPANQTVAADGNCAGAVGSWNLLSKSDNCTASGSISQTQTQTGTSLSGHNSFQTVTLTATDAVGNSASCSFTVTLKDITAPTIACPANQTVAADGNCAGAVGSWNLVSKTDNCTASGSIVQTQTQTGTTLSGHDSFQTVTLKGTDAAGNFSSCSFTVTLKDVTAPAPVCKTAIVSLNAGGTGSITTADVLQSATDNCGTVNQVSVTPNAFNCSNLGTNIVTLLVNDGHGNTATCTAAVNVVDLIAPTMLCKPVALQLDASGNATLTVAQVNNGSFDNCGITLMGLSQTTFTCANLGANTVQLSGTDVSGNKNFCSATVTVQDVIAPVAVCKNAVVQLNASGTVTVGTAQINNGSSDVCGIVSMMLTPNTFTCANVGANTVTLKVTDPGGNTATCTAVVTVQDKVAPTALCKNPTIYLNTLGQASITPADVNNGSNDACGIASLSIDDNSFNCGDIGASPVSVWLTVKDLYNNTATCQSLVTVKDNLAPTAVCQNVSVQLNSQGKATVYGANLAADSYDNCSVWSYSPVSKLYTTANIGVNNLTITVKDWSGNAASCVSQVTVLPFGGQPMAINDNLENNTFIESMELTVFPNPASREATVVFGLPQDQSVQLRLFDATGKLVLNMSLEGLEGENTLPLELGDLPSGLYILDIQSGTERGQKRLAIQR